MSHEVACGLWKYATKTGGIAATIILNRATTTTKAGGTTITKAWEILLDEVTNCYLVDGGLGRMRCLE